MDYKEIIYDTINKIEDEEILAFVAGLLLGVADTQDGGEN